jgi:ABC-type spermidine/putrescine transport system permease subunit II
MLFLYALCRVSVFVPSYFLLHQTLEIQRTDFSSDSSWPHQHFYSTGDYIAFGFLGIICVFLLWPLFCYVYCAVPQAYLFFLGHDHGMHVPFLTQPLVKIVLNSALIALVSCIGSLIMSALLLIVRMHESSSTKKIWLMTAYAPFLLGSGSICALVAVMHYYFGFSCFVSAIISHTLLHYPIAYRFLASQTSGYRGLTLLAYSIGASRWQVVQTVIIPYAQIASVHAVCLTFCLSFAESGAACFGHETSMMTLPLAIRLCRKHEYQEGVYGLSVLVLIITGFATWVSNKYLLNSKKLRS